MSMIALPSRASAFPHAICLISSGHWSGRRPVTSRPRLPRTLLHNGRLGRAAPRNQSKTAAMGGEAHWMDRLRFDGEPAFDVLAKTQEYAEADPDTHHQYWADDYIFRGSVIGPITGKDVQETQQGIKLLSAYPDLKVERFGFVIDPDNPYRCMYFERWSATHLGVLEVAGQKLPPTGLKVKVPAHVTSVNWNPAGEVVYATVSPPLDRFEGNTMGQGAVFGLISFAGIPIGGGVGDMGLVLQQKANMGLGGPLGKNWSAEKDIPQWWKSKARGAEPNDI